MVINRDYKVAQVYAATELDEYGQETLAPLSKSITLTFGLYNHYQTEDPRYTNIDYTGLTNDEVDDSMTLELDNHKYKVEFVNPFGRRKQVFLRKLL